jgi:hypothetical protein
LLGSYRAGILLAVPNVHTIPLNDLIHHLTGSGEECPCGPTCIPIERADGSISYQYVHHSLDGREFAGEDAGLLLPENITCPVCGMTSWNPNDVRYGYCGNCHAFTRGMICVEEKEDMIADSNWDWMPIWLKIPAVALIVLLVLGLLWLLIYGEV